MLRNDLRWENEVLGTANCNCAFTWVLRKVPYAGHTGMLYCCWHCYRPVIFATVYPLRSNIQATNLWL